MNRCRVGAGATGKAAFTKTSSQESVTLFVTLFALGAFSFLSALVLSLLVAMMV